MVPAGIYFENFKRRRMRMDSTTVGQWTVNGEKYPTVHSPRTIVPGQGEITWIC